MQKVRGGCQCLRLFPQQQLPSGNRADYRYEMRERQLSVGSVYLHSRYSDRSCWHRSMICGEPLGSIPNICIENSLRYCLVAALSEGCTHELTNIAWLSYPGELIPGALCYIGTILRYTVEKSG